MLKKGIGIENFRGISQKIWMDFDTLTFLSGEHKIYNDSILDGLKLLDYYFENRKKQLARGKCPDKINVEDIFKELIAFDALVFDKQNKNEFTISIPFEIDYFNDNLTLHLVFKPIEENKRLGILNKLCIYSDNKLNNIFSVERINYLRYEYEIDCISFLDQFIIESEKFNNGQESFLDECTKKQINKIALFEYLKGNKIEKKPWIIAYNENKDYLNKDNYITGSKEYFEAALTRELLENFKYTFQVFNTKEDFQEQMGYEYNSRSASRNNKEDYDGSCTMDKYKEGHYNTLFSKAGLRGIEFAINFMAGGNDAYGDGVNIFSYQSDLKKFLSKEGNNDLLKKVAINGSGELPIFKSDQDKKWFMPFFFEYFIFENISEAFDKLLINKPNKIVFNSNYRDSFQHKILRNDNPLFEEFYKKILALKDKEKKQLCLDFVKAQFARFEIGDRIFECNGFVPMPSLPIILDIAIAAIENEQAVFVLEDSETFIRNSDLYEKFTQMLADAVNNLGMKFIVNSNNKKYL